MAQNLLRSEAITDKLQASVDQILASIGQGVSTMDSVAYDTAWIARLAPHFPGEGFEGALPWLRAHQHPDGSWGGDVKHYHDRVISTLSAIIALREAGNSTTDEQRIRKGEAFLWREYARLYHDIDDTAGFSVLSVVLESQASSLGLDIPRDIYYDAEKIAKKLKLLGRTPQQWRYSTMSFSLEAMYDQLPEELCFLEDNGSVGTSPSATAAVLLASQQKDVRLLRYLRQDIHNQGDGGASVVSPFDTYEVAWTLNNLRLTGVISPDQPEVRWLLDFLWAQWSPDHGIGFSSYYSVPDLDDTAVTFNVLRWGGYPVNADVFDTYEMEDHFRCFAGEINPSLSANIRTLNAIKLAHEHPQFEAWVNKILTMLYHNSRNPYSWHDKWHISPYYLTSNAVIALQGIADDLAKPLVKWLIRTQQPDGGWGSYDRSTAEETAYCLHALLRWDRTTERVDSEQLDAASRYLSARLDDTNRPALWICKALYMPHHIVQSAIVTALLDYLGS